jgi:hypothetical protein
MLASAHPPKWEFLRLNELQDKSLPPILPPGTSVVSKKELRSDKGEVLCPCGAVGVIVNAPVDAMHHYRVRLPGGEEVSLKRDEFQVLRRYQENGMQLRENALIEYDLEQHVIYRCVVGSRAYGLDHSDSDYDRRGIYLPSAEMQWSLFGVPPQLENQETDECYWELQKFLTLALKANPNVLEVLYSPMVEHAAPLAEELLAMRPLFLSQMVYQTYNGYVMSQFKKIEQDLRNQGTVKWKHAMHLIRLLLSGITVLRENFVPVKVAEHRETLLQIRQGKFDWDQVNRWRLELHETFDRAYEKTTLPEHPDYEAANAFLVKARLSMVNQWK